MDTDGDDKIEEENLNDDIIDTIEMKNLIKSNILDKNDFNLTKKKHGRFLLKLDALLDDKSE